MKLKESVRATMHRHGLKHYKRGDVEISLIPELIGPLVVEENVKVRISKSKSDNESDDQPDYM